MRTIKVLDFSEFPGLRHCKVSDSSGEEYYHKVLNNEFYKAFKEKEKLNVILDNTAGFAPSFLDEAFGNLVFDFGLKQIKKYLNVISEQETYLIDQLENETFPQWEERRIRNQKPLKTADHDEWYKYINSEIILSK